MFNFIVTTVCADGLALLWAMASVDMRNKPLPEPMMTLFIALHPRHPACMCYIGIPLRWRHNGRDSVSNHQPHDCLLNRLFRRRSTKTSKLRVTSLCAGNSPVTGEYPAQMASDTENVSIRWRHHVNPDCTLSDVMNLPINNYCI